MHTATGIRKFVARRLGGMRIFAARRDGAAAVEFALIAPTLVALLLGVFEFGMLAWNRHSLEFATEETSRYVMTQTSVTNSDIVTLLNSKVSGISSTDLTTTVTQDTVGTTTFVTMSVSYTYKFFLIGALIGLSPIVFTNQTRVPLRQTS